MPDHLESLASALFAPLTPNEQDATLGGHAPVAGGDPLSFVGITGCDGRVAPDYETDPFPDVLG